MSRFNTLLHGPASEAADELADVATSDETRWALINALEHVDRLEKRLIAFEEWVRKAMRPNGY